MNDKYTSYPFPNQCKTELVQFNIKFFKTNKLVINLDVS